MESHVDNYTDACDIITFVILHSYSKVALDSALDYGWNHYRHIGKISDQNETQYFEEIGQWYKSDQPNPKIIQRFKEITAFSKRLNAGKFIYGRKIIKK